MSQITHQPQTDRELIIYYEAYDLGLQAGVRAARNAIDTELAEEKISQAWLRLKADYLKGLIERALVRAEARRAEVDAKIKELIEQHQEEMGR